MSQNAQTLETTAVASGGYDALSNRELLLALLGVFNLNSSLTAQQAITLAAQNKYGALSDKQLDDAILSIIT